MGECRLVAISKCGDWGDGNESTLAVISRAGVGVEEIVVIGVVSGL